MKNIFCCQGSFHLEEDFQKIINFLKIINEPNRLKILCFLKVKEQCVCDVWKKFDLPQNLVSHHLKVLKDFGLIKSEQDGRKIIYSSNKKMIQKYVSLLNNFLILNL